MIFTLFTELKSYYGQNAILPKELYRFNEISTKTTYYIFHKAKTSDSKNLYGPQIAKDPKKNPNSQSNLRKKAKVKVSCFLTLDHTTKLQLPKHCTGTERHKKRCNDKNAYPYGQLIYNKRSKRVYNRKRQFLQ